MKKRNNQGFGAVELVLIAAVLIAVGFGAWYVLKHNKSDSAKTTTPASTSQTTTSEQPNKAKFSEFFTSFDLAKLPVGQHISPPNSIPTNTTTFSSTDQLCENIKVIKLIPASSLSSAIYDVTTKQNAVPVTAFPNELGPGPGTSSACGALGVTSGHYEYKAYIDNILVVDTAFEVK